VKTEAAFDVFGKTQWNKSEFSGEAVGRGFPNDFVDGVFFADGVHHLADEEFEAAAFVGVDDVGDDDLIVEVLEGGFLFQGAFVAVAAFFWKGDDLEAISRDVLFAFPGDGFDEIVAIFNDFP
jgi:hypothetical protein